jgi:hypothetical protein
VNLRNPILVFIARASHASRGLFNEKRDRLTTSLDAVMEYHKATFPGRFDGNSLEQFVQASKSPFQPGGDVMTYFRALFTCAEQQDRDIRLIMSGWNSFTMNQGAFQELF